MTLLASLASNWPELLFCLAAFALGYIARAGKALSEARRTRGPLPPRLRQPPSGPDTDRGDAWAWEFREPPRSAA